MSEDDPRILERHLLREIAEKERTVALLQHDINALKRSLYVVRKREFSVKEVTRSNSISRVMAENAILERLDDSPRQMVAVAQLQIAVSRTIPNVPDSTFRSHVYRLKARGFIESPRRGFWRRVRPNDQAEGDKR